MTAGAKLFSGALLAISALCVTFAAATAVRGERIARALSTENRRLYFENAMLNDALFAASITKAPERCGD